MDKWLVIYDIRDIKRLRKVAKIMLNYGIRVQKSVFEIECSKNILNRLKEEIHNIINENDFVVYFNVCEKDWQKKLKYGVLYQETDVEEKDFYIL
ncbi:MAG: CRISPR-associated endonuclease Cas2 [Candidatus Acididesulfobacter guangdongensis]|uniref:CRISPR-associated endoribonuclease Cas2 n=1 Tax=Acididesulfobacter guangdongensis TaxID=2597225 RepID=A0A519BIT9_ACIG2|nr:MAG: CRISPR-associated endonuclease Cas2 [Candidatus Acididesulfobacter guangdongensis]